MDVRNSHWFYVRSALTVLALFLKMSRMKPNKDWRSVLLHTRVNCPGWSRIQRLEKVARAPVLSYPRLISVGAALTKLCPHGSSSRPGLCLILAVRQSSNALVQNKQLKKKQHDDILSGSVHLNLASKLVGLKTCVPIGGISYRGQVTGSGRGAP